MSNIKSITPIGKHQTYDLEVDHPDHQFYLANGVLTSNSHAVAYAIDSYWCAWLMTYFEKEWLTAYVESMLNSPEKKAVAFSEIKQLGYDIAQIDVNYASDEWTVLPGKKFMPSFYSCKSIGEAAVQEILQNRPYKNIEDMLYNSDGTWRHSKFNKRVLETLIKIKALGSLDAVGQGKLFNNWHQAFKVLIEHNDEIKKSPKKNPYAGMERMRELAEYYRNNVPEWTKVEQAQFQIELFGSFDVTSVVSPQMLAKLETKEINPIETLEEGDKNIVWFVPTSLEIKMTKNKKSYAVISALGLGAKPVRLSVWGFSDKSNVNLYNLHLAEVERNNFGCSTTTWKLKEVNE